MSEEEVRRIAQSACQYKKGSSPPPEILAAVEVVDSYYLENPPKGMAEYTDRDITEAFLQEALLHGSPVKEGIELSISYGSLADKAGIGDRALSKALNERLFKSGHFKRGNKPKGLRSGTLILVITKFYATVLHSTNNGLNAERLHKSLKDEDRSR